MAEVSHMQNSRNADNVNHGKITSRATDAQGRDFEIWCETVLTDYDRGYDDGEAGKPSQENSLGYHFGWLDGLTAFDPEMFPDPLGRFDPGYGMPEAPFTTETGDEQHTGDYWEQLEEI